MTDDKDTQLRDMLYEVGVIIKKLHNEYLAIHKEECKVLDKKIALNKRIGNLKGKLGNMKLWHEAYDRACPDRKFDI